MSFKLVVCSACALDTGCAFFLRSLPWSKAIITSLNASVDAVNNISVQTGHELAAIGLNSDAFTFIGNGTTLPKCVHQFIDGNNRKMLCISRLASNKGHALLIDALAVLKDDGNHIDMTFIGDGPEKQRLELLVEKKNLAGNIHFLGHIDNDLIFEHLVQYDIFILPSDTEGFATVVIESMAAGLPVIVTRSGGPEYFVDKQVGRTCERKNMQALLHSIKELLDMKTEELEAMGMRGRKLVLDRFEMNSVAQQYEVLFNRLLR